MSNIYDPKLVAEFVELVNKFEGTVRADERKRLLEKFRSRVPATRKQTDMHGEALDASRRQKSGLQPNDLNATHAALISWLSRGTFMAVPTLAGHLGMKKESVYHYLSGLKKAGYQIEIRSTGNRKGGYINIYRLAKTG